MSYRKELILLLLSDLVTINVAYAVYYFIRIESGWIPAANTSLFWEPMFLIYIIWLVFFTFSGLYQHWFNRGRFDEFISILRVVTLGCLVLFFAIFLDDFIRNAQVISRFLIVIYWAILMFFVSTGRLLLRWYQLKLLDRGIGLRNAAVVGTGNTAAELIEMIKKLPRLGFKYIGTIGIDNEEAVKDEIGKLSDIKNVIEQYDITDVLIASQQKDKNLVITTLNNCAGTEIRVKIMPEVSEIISGMVRTDQIYGIPLIEVRLNMITVPEKILKRIIDLFLSLFVLIFLSPLFLLIALLIKLTSKGPAISKRIRVGLGGKVFVMYSFRTMSEETDKQESQMKISQSLTFIGKIIRKLRFDELPQFFNVLKNDMSIVGPRPEKVIFVEQLKKEIPYYSRRLSVKPGITGWAQVKSTSNVTLDDSRRRLQYDFYYIENMSILLDLKIMLNTILVIFSMKGR